MQLTRWNYTKEEWKNFLHWKTRKKGLIFFLFRKLVPVKSQEIPEIKITTDTVWINNAQESFQDHQRQYREINIRSIGLSEEPGNINIPEISYEHANRIRGIKIPIPRGKLREAFEVQQRLDNWVVGHPIVLSGAEGSGFKVFKNEPPFLCQGRLLHEDTKASLRRFVLLRVFLPEASGLVVQISN